MKKEENSSNGHVSLTIETHLLMVYAGYSNLKGGYVSTQEELARCRNGARVFYRSRIAGEYPIEEVKRFDWLKEGEDVYTKKELRENLELCSTRIPEETIDEILEQSMLN